MAKQFLKALNGEQTDHIPFWLMRQAGRYLPEYRELRSNAGGFLDMVYNPEFATEVTMQPLRRFGMDAAILFSDILVIPHALGQHLEFVQGEGPKLEPIRDETGLSALNPAKIDDILGPVYETVRGVRASLEKENFHDCALIGFAGSPWTVATYMVEGGGSKDFSKIKKWAYGAPDSFQKLIDIVTDATIHYLSKQVEAGAEALQIFDSWAGVLDRENFERWVIAPSVKICNALKEKHPDTPLIGFPRGAGFFYEDYAQQLPINAIGLDSNLDTKWVSEKLQPRLCVQGNMDPCYLLAGGQQMEDRILQILNDFGAHPFVFNLGHGVIKETPPENVARLAEILKSYKQ